MHLSDSAASNWPILQVQYDSYVADSGPSVHIEWQASFDPNLNEIISRVLTAIVMRSDSGQEEAHLLTTQRVDPSDIQITDVLTKKTVLYPCTDPCVVIGPDFARLWTQ